MSKKAEFGPFHSFHLRRRGRKRVVAFLLAAFVCASILVALPAPASAAPSQHLPSSLTLGQGEPIVLGAPGGSATELNAPPVVPPPAGDFFGVIGDGVKSFCSLPLIPCPGNIANGLGNDLTALGCIASAPITWSTDTCQQSRKDVMTTAVGVATIPLSTATKLVMETFQKTIRDATNGWITFILHDQLGGNDSILRPQINTAWFMNQYSLMRGIALFILVPLLMLLIINSIIRGSLFFLLRSVLVMLPISVVGSVFLVSLTDLMLKVSDDFSDAIANHYTDIGGFGSTLGQQVSGMNAGDFGLFGLLWMLLFILAAVVIFFELLLRQAGIYLAAFFLPLAFMGLVWPATAKYAKHLLELLLALIFAKVFIIAALSLGVAALGHGGIGPPTQTALGAPSQTQQAISALAAGTAIVGMAALSGMKIISMTPAAVAAAEGRVLQLGKVHTFGKWQSQLAGMYREHLHKKHNNITPESGPFPNGPGAGGAGAGGGLPRPLGGIGGGLSSGGAGGAGAAAGAGGAGAAAGGGAATGGTAAGGLLGGPVGAAVGAAVGSAVAGGVRAAGGAVRNAATSTSPPSGGGRGQDGPNGSRQGTEPSGQRPSNAPSPPSPPPPTSPPPPGNGGSN